MFYRKLLTFIIICLPIYTIACDKNRIRQQSIAASSAGQKLEHWVVSSSNIKKLVMPNGFSLGIQIEPATSELYSTQAEVGKFIPEMVSLTVYDMSTEPPQILTHTWGGSNSLQVYSSKGGADTVIELGPKGITIHLRKPICVKTSA